MHISDWAYKPSEKKFLTQVHGLALPAVNQL